jgi:hypothetical protein
MRCASERRVMASTAIMRQRKAARAVAMKRYRAALRREAMIEAGYAAVIALARTETIKSRFVSAPLLRSHRPDHHIGGSATAGAGNEFGAAWARRRDRMPGDRNRPMSKPYER